MQSNKSVQTLDSRQPLSSIGRIYQESNEQGPSGGSLDPQYAASVRNSFRYRPDASKKAAYQATGEKTPCAEDVAVITLSEFVSRKFIPEHVRFKRPSGQAHFNAILKLILSPQNANRDERLGASRLSGKHSNTPEWPYLNSFRLCEIDESCIHQLTSRAMESGYSTQTATHIRNVIRAIFSHAINNCSYPGENPAGRVALPAMKRKEAQPLSVSQLTQLLPSMRYPERGIALFTLLSDMKLAETCGLQWKYVNLSNAFQPADMELIPPRSIAIRFQCYRTKFEPVIPCRRRFIPISELLYSMFTYLRSRRSSVHPWDFVLASRSGTPLHLENIAARKLKVIGKAHDMPWLSWSTFQRTRISLTSKSGNSLPPEFERLMLF